MRGFAMRLMHLGLQVHVVDDVTTPAIRRDDLLIVGSGSGRTASLANVARKAKQEGADVALVTLSARSAIGDVSDTVIVIDAPSPKAAGAVESTSIMPMGSLFEVALGILFEIVTVQLMQETGMTSDRMFERHANLE
ncbi:MAG TPA: 6-phospho-3-hexuloisomerase [Gammaproteobacteria bacterium]|nr:6-phospho-3-hexuloisomerase [Gammaproteobacteria bacterium]